MNKMFVVAKDKKNELAGTPTIWLKTIKSETGYYWPLYGLQFKLKNYVPLPVNPQELENEWRFVPCSILLNGKTFKTYPEAEKAILKILKEDRSNEVQSKGMELKELKSKKLECVEQELLEHESVEQESFEQESVEQESVEQESVEQESVEQESVEQESVEQVSVEEESVEQVSVEEESVVNELVEHEVVEQELVEQESDDEKFKNFPLVEVKNFVANELFLKKKNGFNELKEFYLKINQNSQSVFFNECVDVTFDDVLFFEKITFKKDKKKAADGINWLGPFYETRLYKCLKEAVVEKFKLNDLDDTDLKKIFITNFDRIKRAKKAST